MSGPIMSPMTILPQSSDALTNQRVDQTSQKLMQKNIHESRIAHLNYFQQQATESGAKISEETRQDAGSYQVTISKEARNIDTVYNHPKIGSVYAAPR